MEHWETNKWDGGQTNGKWKYLVDCSVVGTMHLVVVLRLQKKIPTVLVILEPEKWLLIPMRMEIDKMENKNRT
jgi:hypothetical protein